jgi:hypothetical protein
MERLPAAWTVDWARFVERVSEIASTTALGLERFVAANDAIAIVALIRAESTANGAMFSDLRDHGGNLNARRNDGVPHSANYQRREGWCWTTVNTTSFHAVRRCAASAVALLQLRRLYHAS